MKIYYTYHIIDPQNNKVFYVGKGHGQRAYIHLTRALKWRKNGKLIPGANKHLYNKLLQIHDQNLQPIYHIALETPIEKEALEREQRDILLFGIENLCNLTYGGEGETRTDKSLEKLSKSLRKFWNSEDGYAMREKFSQDKIGKNNPMFGYEMTQEEKDLRVKCLLSVPRWNKGLKGDPRCKGFVKGQASCNRIPCRLINNDGRIFEANSITELAKISGVPLISIQRLRSGIYKKNKKGWRFEVV